MREIYGFGARLPRPARRRLVSSGDGVVRVRDLRAGPGLRAIPTGHPGFDAACLSSVGRRLASTSSRRARADAVRRPRGILARSMRLFMGDGGYTCASPRRRRAARRDSIWREEHMRKGRTNVLALAALAACSAGARADTVRLTEDRTVEDVRVRSAGADRVTLVKHGMEATIARRELVAVEPGPVDEERVALAVAAARGDPPRLDGAARLARALGLAARAGEIEAMARDIRLEREAAARAERLAAILAEVDRRDAAALVVAAERIEAADLGTEAAAGVYRMALAADRENEAAHAALGETKFEGSWVTIADAARLRSERFAAAQRAKGLVLRAGGWMTPSEARLADEAEALAARRREVEAAAERERRAAERAEEERERWIAAREAARERAAAARAEAEAEACRIAAARARAEACERARCVEVACAPRVVRRRNTAAFWTLDFCTGTSGFTYAPPPPRRRRR
jgi:hypothetical protein